MHANDREVFLQTAEIYCIEAGEGATTIFLENGSRYFSSKRFGEFEDLPEHSGNFFRINKSVMINSDHIKDYSKGEPCFITMSGGKTFEVSRRRKSDILKKLKAVSSGNNNV